MSYHLGQAVVFHGLMEYLPQWFDFTHL